MIKDITEQHIYSSDPSDFIIWFNFQVGEP